MKEEFMKKHRITEKDYKNLVRFEYVRKLGVINMFEYLFLMKSHGVNGGAKLAALITEGGFYSEFLKTVEGE